MRIVVYMEFGRIGHQETATGGPWWTKTIGNRWWWEQRERIMRAFTLPSLAQQTAPVEIVGRFARETPTGYADGCMAAIRGAGGRVIMGSAMETVNRHQVPTQAAFRALARDGLPLAALWLDSDDAYSKDAAEIVGSQDPLEGAVYAFRSGYCYDFCAGRLNVYHPMAAPPPFFARVYTRNAFRDLDAYEAEHVFLTNHWQLPKSRLLIDLHPGRFCFAFHNAQTSSTVEKQRKKMFEEIEGEERTRILSQFGDPAKIVAFKPGPSPGEQGP